MSLLDALRILRNLRLSRSGNAGVACAGCGQSFQCGASLRGCWCSEIKLTEAARAELKQLYSSCLCRTCLERAAEKQSLQPQGNADKRR